MARRLYQIEVEVGPSDSTSGWVPVRGAAGLLATNAEVTRLQAAGRGFGLRYRRVPREPLALKDVAGACIGEIVGSPYEYDDEATGDYHFPVFGPRTRFTDDSVLTWATMDALMTAEGYPTVLDFTRAYKEYARREPSDYGARFGGWARSSTQEPYNSMGNGSAMRVSPVGWWATSPPEALALAVLSACATHNHPEGVRGAQSAALALYLARTGHGLVPWKDRKEYIFERLARHNLDYMMSSSMADSVLSRHNRMDETCPGTMPIVLAAFWKGEDYIDTLRLAISAGGDSDTIGAIVGGIASAFYGGVPEKWLGQGLGYIPVQYRELMALFADAAERRWQGNPERAEVLRASVRSLIASREDSHARRASR